MNLQVVRHSRINTSDYNNIVIYLHRDYYTMKTDRYYNFNYDNNIILDFRADVQKIEIAFVADTFIQEFDSFMPILLKWTSTINTDLLILHGNRREKMWEFFTYFSFIRIGHINLFADDEFWIYFVESFARKIFQREDEEIISNE